MLDSYSNCIAQLNNGIQQSWTYVQIKPNRFVIKLLRAFYHYNLIDGFFINSKIKNTKQCTIYLKYFNGLNLMRKVNTFSLPGNFYFLTKKKIEKKMKTNPHNIYFVSTISGIKGYRFIDKKYVKVSGGLLLCSVTTL